MTYSVIKTKPEGEYLASYSPVGNVCRFTRDFEEAKRVDMEYGPSSEWAWQALQVVRSVYQRTAAKMEHIT